MMSTGRFGGQSRQTTSTSLSCLVLIFTKRPPLKTASALKTREEGARCVVLPTTTAWIICIYICYISQSKCYSAWEGKQIAHVVYLFQKLRARKVISARDWSLPNVLLLFCGCDFFSPFSLVFFFRFASLSLSLSLRPLLSSREF